MTTLITVVATTVVFLGLAIFGRGGFAAFFSEPALVAIAVSTVAMSVVALFTQGNLSRGEREDRANRWIFPVFAVISILSAWLPAYTDRHEIGTFGGGDGVRWVGVALYIVGGALRIWPVFVLGNRFSGLVAIQPGHTLVTSGVYRVIRNPSYLGLLINLLGWALAFRSVAGVLLALAAVIPLVSRMHAEEALLRAQFGEQYDAYYARTWRLIPGVY